MRFVRAEIAGEAGLDVHRFLSDWDSGRFRQTVIEESHRGGEVLRGRSSPTFVLPSGKQVNNPAAPEVTWGPHHSIERLAPPTARMVTVSRSTGICWKRPSRNNRHNHSTVERSFARCVSLPPISP